MNPRVDADSVNRILVVKLRAIGDVLLSTVVIDNLRRRFPRAEIHFLTEPPAAGLLTYDSAIDRILVFDRKTMSGGNLIRTVRRQRYDLVIDLFGNPRTALVTRLSGAHHRVGFRFRGRSYAYNHLVEPRGDRVHNTQFNLDALEAIGVPVHARVPRLAVSPDERAWAAGYLSREVHPDGPVVAINPGGGWYTKRWGRENFAAVADRLVREERARILILWGPAEREGAEEIAATMSEPALLPPKTTLLQLAALLERCTLVVTNDSGPMHIAAAMGTPVVAIFGPTNPHLQGPSGGSHTVVQAQGLDCLGCNLTKCPIGHPCMRNLPVEVVVEHAQRLLRGSPPAAAQQTFPG